MKGKEKQGKDWLTRNIIQQSVSALRMEQWENARILDKKISSSFLDLGL